MVAPDNGRPTRFCLSCAYPLCGLPEPRCPECGGGFDPDDPATYVVRPVGRWARFFLRAPTWRLHLLVAGAALCSLWTFSNPGHLLAWVWVILTWPWLLLFWGLKSLGYLVVWIRYQPGRRFRAAVLWPWLAVPAVFLVAMALVSTDIPLRVRFLASVSAMEAVRQQAERFPPTSIDGVRFVPGFRVPERVGLYWPDDVHTWPNQFRVMVGRDLMWKHGFAFLDSDPGIPRDGGWYMVSGQYGERRWLYGKWYLCRIPDPLIKFGP